MPIIETLPKEIVLDRDDIILAIMADVDDEGDYAKKWLVVTNEIIYVFLNNSDIQYEIEVNRINGARMVNAIGGGSLIVDTDEGAIILVRFTAAFTKKIRHCCTNDREFDKG